MLILSIDTSETRGSVALLRLGEPLSVKRHEGNSDYSEWLLTAVDEVLAEAHTRMEDLGLLAVSTGPGSFTGLRVGLTTVKAWAEVYGKPVVGVSRLEALARSHRPESDVSFIASCYDAQRGQLFGALYHCAFGQLALIEDEQVIPPQEFLAWVTEHAESKRVEWISLDPELITPLAGWSERASRGDAMLSTDPQLAVAIGRLAEERAQHGQFSDPLQLDANYVRRSDAEIFWKGRA